MMHMNSFVLFHVSRMITIEYLLRTLLRLMKAPTVNGILADDSELSRCINGFYSSVFSERCLLVGHFKRLLRLGVTHLGPHLCLRSSSCMSTCMAI